MRVNLLFVLCLCLCVRCEILYRDVRRIHLSRLYEYVSFCFRNTSFPCAVHSNSSFLFRLCISFLCYRRDIVADFRAFSLSSFTIIIAKHRYYSGYLCQYHHLFSLSPYLFLIGTYILVSSRQLLCSSPTTSLSTFSFVHNRLLNTKKWPTLACHKQKSFAFFFFRLFSIDL